MSTADLQRLAATPGLTRSAYPAPADYLHQAVLGAGLGAEWPAQAFPVAIQRVGIVGAGDDQQRARHCRGVVMADAEFDSFALGLVQGCQIGRCRRLLHFAGCRHAAALLESR